METKMLTNPDFENGFREIDGIGELKVANAWYPWWDANTARPEYRDAAPHTNRIHFGNHASQWFNTYNKHTAGIYQIVTGITPGATLAFSAWVQCFSSNEDDFSQSKGRYRMRIGIEPYGQTDPNSSDMVWSGNGHSIQPYDKYQHLIAETIAKSDRCTVFVWGQAEWPLKHNDAYVDECWLATGDSMPPNPGGPSEVDYERIRQVVREELDKTRLSQ